MSKVVRPDAFNWLDPERVRRNRITLVSGGHSFVDGSCADGFTVSGRGLFYIYTDDVGWHWIEATWISYEATPWPHAVLALPNGYLLRFHEARIDLARRRFYRELRSRGDGRLDTERRIFAR